MLAVRKTKNLKNKNINKLYKYLNSTKPFYETYLYYAALTLSELQKNNAYNY